MHPPERGFGKPPRNQQPNQTGAGSRPFLQGHLKPSRSRHPQAPATEPAGDAAVAGRPPAQKKASAPTKAPAPKKPAAPEGPPALKKPPTTKLASGRPEPAEK